MHCSNWTTRSEGQEVTQLTWITPKCCLHAYFGAVAAIIEEVHSTHECEHGLRARLVL